MLTLADNAAPAEQAAKFVLSAYDILGLPVKIVRAPHSRTLLMASSGRADGEIATSAAVEEKFPTLMRVNVPLVAIPVIVFVCEDVEDALFRAALSSKRVGRLSGAVVLENLTKDYENVWAGETFDELFDMLKAGRLDAVLGPKVALKKYRTKHDLDCIRRLQTPVKTVHLYHYLHEKNAALIPLVTEALKQVTHMGPLGN